MWTFYGNLLVKRDNVMETFYLCRFYTPSETHVRIKKVFMNTDHREQTKKTPLNTFPSILVHLPYWQTIFRLNSLPSQTILFTKDCSMYIPFLIIFSIFLVDFLLRFRCFRRVLWCISQWKSWAWQWITCISLSNFR